MLELRSHGMKAAAKHHSTQTGNLTTVKAERRGFESRQVKNGKVCSTQVLRLYLNQSENSDV